MITIKFAISQCHNFFKLTIKTSLLESMYRCTTDGAVDAQHGNLPNRTFLPLGHTWKASNVFNLSEIKRPILNVAVIHFDIKEAVATMSFIVFSDNSDIESYRQRSGIGFQLQ